MINKKIGYYTDIQAHAPASISAADQLIIEIGTDQLVIMVKSQLPKQVESFELFTVDNETDWTDSLNRIKKESGLLTRHYNNVLVVYNLPEALAVPSSQFTTEAGKDFLDQIYGDAYPQIATHETVFAARIEIAYRVRREIPDWLNKELPNHKSSHLYAQLLNNAYTHELPEHSFVMIGFYRKHMVTAVIKNKQLQIIQSFTHEVDEDILYYIMSLCQQFNIDPAQAQAVISGELDRSSGLAKKLPSLIGSITWEEAGNSGVFSKLLSQYPAHYFTPYYKLGA